MSLQILRARLVPINNNERAPEKDWIPVQFNPNSLRINYTNTLAAERSTGKSSSPAPQYIDKSESTFAVQLIYDTTVPGPAQGEFSWTKESVAGNENYLNEKKTGAATHEANTDVRNLTKKITDQFIDPTQSPQSKGHSVPRKCQFEWGAFIFRGMVTSYSETLDFFSPEGIPLRATVALTLKEDSFQFEQVQIAAKQRAAVEFAAALNAPPPTSPAPPGAPAGIAPAPAAAAAAVGKNPRDWRDVALLNGVEDVRAQARQALAVPSVELDKMASRVGSPATGFSVGASASLGSGIPGAFKWR